MCIKTSSLDIKKGHERVNPTHLCGPPQLTLPFPMTHCSRPQALKPQAVWLKSSRPTQLQRE